MKHFIDAALQQGADQAEVYFQNTTLEEITFENNKLKQVSTKRLQGLNLRIVKDGKLGTINSSDLSNPTHLADKVLELAKFGDQVRFDFNTPDTEYPDPVMISAKVNEPTTEQLIGVGEAMIARVLAYDANIQVTTQIQRVTNHRELLNTRGLQISDTTYDIDSYGYTFLVEGDNFISVLVPAQVEHDQLDLHQVADELIERMKIARINVTMESGRYPVIFSPNAIAQMTVALEGMNAMNVLKGVSPLKDKLNTQIFADQITLIDDGTLPKGRGTARFDDEGTPTQRTVLVENGILKGFLHNLESAKEMGVSATGNAWKRGQEYSRPAQIRFSNLSFAPGTRSLDEMLQEIDLGLLIEDISGLMMGNLMQGNMDSDIDMAYKIENGKIVGRVKNGAIGSNIYQVLKNHVIALENKVHPLNYGYGVYVPHILCKDINITIG